MIPCPKEIAVLKVKIIPKSCSPFFPTIAIIQSTMGTSTDDAIMSIYVCWIIEWIIIFHLMKSGKIKLINKINYKLKH